MQASGFAEQAHELSVHSARQLLEVVQHQQAALSGQRSGHAVQRVLAADAQRDRQGVNRGSGLGAVDHRHKDHAVKADVKALLQCWRADGSFEAASNVHGQARLAAAARAKHRHQTLAQTKLPQTNRTLLRAVQPCPMMRQLPHGRALRLRHGVGRRGFGLEQRQGIDAVKQVA